MNRRGAAWRIRARESKCVQVKAMFCNKEIYNIVTWKNFICLSYNSPKVESQLGGAALLH